MGNLSEAFRERDLWQALRERELEQMATQRARRNPFYAELMEGKAMTWHVAQTFPAMEVRATAHLAARRIGAYLPMVLSRRDDGTTRQRPMFPEYVFVCLSDIAAHRTRIRGIPGIRQIVLDGDGEVVVPDLWIDRVQRIELAEMLHSGEVDIVAKKKGKRRWRGPRNPEVAENGKPFIVSMACKSHWRTEEDELSAIMDLDDAGRNSLLHKVLGLNAMPPGAECTSPATVE